MKREYVDYTIQKLKCVPNGSKEACVKVREYLQNIQLNRKNNTISSNDFCCISSEEFIDSVQTLLAYAWQNREQDMVPESWYCDNDCSNIDSCIFCPGEYQLASKDESGKSLSKRLCPYFRDSRNI